MIGTALGAAVGSHAALKITVGTLTAALTVGGTAAITGDQPDTEHCIVVDAASDARLTTPQLAITGYGDVGLGVDDLVELDGDGVAALYIDGVDASVADAAEVGLCLDDEGKAGSSEALPAIESGDDAEATAGQDPEDDGQTNGGQTNGEASTGESDAAGGTTTRGDGKEMTKDTDGAGKAEEADGRKSMTVIIEAEVDETGEAEVDDGDLATADADADLAIEGDADVATHSDTAGGLRLFIQVSTQVQADGNVSVRVAPTGASFMDKCLG